MAGSGTKRARGSTKRANKNAGSGQNRSQNAGGPQWGRTHTLAYNRLNQAITETIPNALQTLQPFMGGRRSKGGTTNQNMA